MKRLLKTADVNQEIQNLVKLMIDYLNNKFLLNEHLNNKTEYINYVKQLNDFLVNYNFNNYDYRTFVLDLANYFDNIRNLVKNKDKLYSLEQRFLDKIDEAFDNLYREQCEKNNKENNKEELQEDSDDILLCEDCMRKRHGYLYEDFNNFAEYYGKGTCPECNQQGVHLFKLL